MISKFNFNNRQRQFMEILRNLQLRKAAGPDQIINEMIKYGGEELKKGIFRLAVKVWKEEWIPRNNKDGLVVPIYKNVV